jgi:hypothetical protein
LPNAPALGPRFLYLALFPNSHPDASSSGCRLRAHLTTMLKVPAPATLLPTSARRPNSSLSSRSRVPTTTPAPPTSTTTTRPVLASAENVASPEARKPSRATATVPAPSSTVTLKRALGAPIKAAAATPLGTTRKASGGAGEKKEYGAEGVKTVVRPGRVLLSAGAATDKPPSTASKGAFEAGVKLWTRGMETYPA